MVDSMGPGVSDSQTLDVAGADKPSFMRFNPFDRQKDATSARKTVTFGDASEVTGSWRAALLTVMALLALWYLVTAVWGMPDVWNQYFDERQSTLADGEIYTERTFLLDCEKSVGLREGDSERYAELYADFESRNGALPTCEFFQGVEESFLPGPGKVWDALYDFTKNGYGDDTFWTHLWGSVSRLSKGLFYGSVFGIAIGLAMGLSNTLRGIFDPIVELLRPIPPLALIPLFIVWFGIGEEGKVDLLIFASVWIMVIAARSGVLAVNVSKVHAAYSLGASKPQVLRHVILPNALPEIFTGFRVATGVCWGTLVAAELLGAPYGLGFTIFKARQFALIDIMLAAVVIISILGVTMDLALRASERRLIPWRGKG